MSSQHCSTQKMTKNCTHSAVIHKIYTFKCLIVYKIKLFTPLRKCTNYLLWLKYSTLIHPPSKKYWKHEKVSMIWKQFSDVKIIEVFLVDYARNFQLAPNVGEKWKLFNGRKKFSFCISSCFLYGSRKGMNKELFEIIKKNCTAIPLSFVRVGSNFQTVSF